MNQPEYIIVDEVGLIVNAVKTALALPALNYQFGYVKELNETLQQYSQNNTDAAIKFPCVWLEQPFNIVRGASASFYGTIEVMRIFIMNNTEPSKKAKDRMTDNFKPVIYPVYREFLKQLDLSIAFSTQSVERIDHTFTDRYFWGENQKEVLSDPIDCSIITIRKLMIANNSNCTPSSEWT